MASTFWARIDSNTANNAALNLTGDPAIEITFVASGGSGDVILDQPAGGGIDPNTQVVINGVSYNFTFELSGSLPTLNSDGANQVPEQFEGSAVYVVTVHDYPAVGESTRLTFLPDGSATQTDMDAFGNGAISVQNLDVTPPPSPVCFAAGTKILTPRGEVLVEDLQAGDIITTLDDGPMPIIWISKSTHSWPLEDDKSKPIKISAGALGQNTPMRDLVVSPLHKVLLSDACFSGLFAESEVLAPAKGLLSLPGVRQMKGKKEIVYYHILMATHSILVSDGAPSESFFPGPCAIGMLKQHQRDAVFALFPDLVENPETGYGPLARRGLSRAETERVVEQIKWLRVSEKAA